MTRHADRIEYRAFVDWVFDDASVLDLGCGDGELLSFLIRSGMYVPKASNSANRQSYVVSPRA